VLDADHTALLGALDIEVAYDLMATAILGTVDASAAADVAIHRQACGGAGGQRDLRDATCRSPGQSVETAPGSRRPRHEKRGLTCGYMVAGAGFEPATFGL
jgi:hypothetical protein